MRGFSRLKHPILRIMYIMSNRRIEFSLISLLQPNCCLELLRQSELYCSTINERFKIRNDTGGDLASTWVIKQCGAYRGPATSQISWKKNSRKRRKVLFSRLVG
jgi:hypothetical protein